jgi:RimJ/RimL family protein N-acetyltransferase
MTGPRAAHLNAREAVASLLDVDEVAWVGLSAPVEVDFEPDLNVEQAVALPTAVTVAGTRVALRAARPADASLVWRWLAQSDLTPRRLGSPHYPDHPIPSFAAFSNDYALHYFDGSAPYDGRGFVIHSLALQRDVGFVSHERLDVLNDVTCLDLWLADSSVCGQGFGSEAIDLLCRWLQAQRGINRFLLRPSRRNVRALRALRRAGFRETDLPPMQVIDKLSLSRGDYPDEVLLFRFLPLPSQRVQPPVGHCHVYIDSEFTRLTQPQLLSFGAVADDDGEFYGEIAETLDESSVPLADRCSEFVCDVVLPLFEQCAQPRAKLANRFASWLADRARGRPITLISDSGFDRWALSDLLGTENLPDGAQWLRVPVAYETLDQVAHTLDLRRHHALDDAIGLRHAVIHGD